MAESGKKGVVDDTCRSRESPRKDSRKRPEAMLPLTPPEPGGPCGLRNESTQRASPGTPSRLPSGDASARRPLFLPCSPVSGKAVHGGIACCISSPGDQSLASACAQLQARDMILDLSDLSACTDVLGQGSMGVLFAATLSRQGTERPVAVKHRLPSETAAGCPGPDSMKDTIWSMLMGAKIKPRKFLSNACPL